MTSLPTKKQIRNLFPGYKVSIQEREMSVAVARLTLRTVPALVIESITSKTETRYSMVKGRTYPIQMETLVDGLKILRDAGYNAWCSTYGLTIIPSDVIRSQY